MSSPLPPRMPCLDGSREWVLSAVEKLNADLTRSADTHLIPVDLPLFPRLHLYFKDESVHPSGSLKHRLARSLFLYAIVNGWVKEGTTVIENSSGSTAVSEAYFAKLLGLPFVAVCPKSTSPQKLAAIQRYHGSVHHVEHADLCEAECRRLAAAPNSHFMDQFTVRFPQLAALAALLLWHPTSPSLPPTTSWRSTRSAPLTTAATTTLQSRCLRKWRGRCTQSPPL